MPIGNERERMVIAHSINEAVVRAHRDAEKKFGMREMVPSAALSALERLLSAPPAQAVIASFIALIVTLLVRPTGLFVPTPK